MIPRIYLVSGAELPQRGLGGRPVGITNCSGLRPFCPSKDAPILLAAIEAQSTHLLTGDMRHFGPYLGKKVAGITIALPGDYLRALVRKK
ncbi:MAG: hypothetical protein DMG77_17505 [Acidobacteria bacterium]|nr:MAG: hypothetical protein DMG77_17505 [Acidobacteriota bacterium]